MWNHYIEDHNSDGSRPIFSMKVLKCHKTPLYRQVHEAILIAKNEPITLNAKNEYNRCLLPRLSVMIGEIETKEKPTENLTEDNQLEDDLEQDTKRKTVNFANHRKSKRIKIDKQAGIRNLGPVWQPNLSKVQHKSMTRKIPQAVKRRLLEVEKEDSPKKIRKSQNVIQSLNQSKPNFCQKSATSQSHQYTENLHESSAKYLISHFELLKSQAETQNPESNVKPSLSQSQCLREKPKIPRKISLSQSKTRRVSRAHSTLITNYFPTTSEAKTEARAKELPPTEEKPPHPKRTKPIQKYFQTTGEAANKVDKSQNS